MEELRRLVHEVPNFPKKGVHFKDISPLLAPEYFGMMVDALASKISEEFDVVAGIESRGFILGAALAQKLGKGFLPIRKRGKLPPPTVAVSYSLEYGTDQLEMRPGRGKILLVDDVLATGGTLKAGADLCVEAGYSVCEILVLIDLKFLNRFQWNAMQAKSLIQYN